MGWHFRLAWTLLLWKAGLPPGSEPADDSRHVAEAELRKPLRLVLAPIAARADDQYLLVAAQPGLVGADAGRRNVTGALGMTRLVLVLGPHIHQLRPLSAELPRQARVCVRHHDSGSQLATPERPHGRAPVISRPPRHDAAVAAFDTDTTL